MFSTMKSLLPLTVILAVGLAVSGAACGTTGDPVVPTAPSVSPATVTETFTGTVLTQSSDAHNFIVQVTSPLAVTLTVVTPNVPVGMGIGVPSGLSCSLTLGTGSSLITQASANAQLKGTAIPGTFCVVVYDAGDVMESVEYTVTVHHG